MLAVQSQLIGGPRTVQTRCACGRVGQNPGMPWPSTLRRQLLAASLLWPLRALTAQTAPAPAIAPAPAPGQVWRVGAGLPISRIADAIRQAADGDTIEILPGDDVGDVAVIRQRRLTLVGLGSGAQDRPRLLAAGQHAEGKAIWVLRDGDVRVARLHFEGARVPDGNGAGIRFEKGHLHLTQCSFQDNQNGVLTGNDIDSSLMIDDCDFGQAPANPGNLPHLLYVGRIAHVSIRGSRFRAGHEGHLIKSRARRTTLIGNLLDDGPTGQASYEIDLPEGGEALVEDNTVVQSIGTHNPVMLAYGAEQPHWPLNRLTLRGNTFINRLPGGGWFVRVWADRLPAGAEVLSQGNRYLGPGSLLLGPTGRSVDDQRGPVTPAAPA